MAAIFHSRSCQYRVQKSRSLQCALGLFYFHLACCDSAVLTGFGSGALRFTWRGCFKARKGNILQQDCEGSVSSLTAGHQPRRSILLRDFWLTRACSGLSAVRLVQIARWSTNDVSGVPGLLFWSWWASQFHTSLGWAKKVKLVISSEVATSQFGFY